MKREPVWSALAIAVSCLALVAAILCASDSDLEHLFITDALYLPSIYHDIAQGAGWSGLNEWLFNPAPNFFPDMGLFLALNGLFGDLRVATYAFAIVQLVLILVLFRAIVRTSGVAHSDTGIALGIVMMSLLAMMGHWAGDFNLTFQLLINSYHTGAFVNTLLCTLLLTLWFKRKQVAHLALICLIIVLAAASDKLFWVMFVIPAVAVCLVLALHGLDRRRALLSAALIILCTWAAARGLRILDQKLPMNIAAPYAYLEFDHITRSWTKLVEVYRWFLQGPPLMLWNTLLPLAMTLWATFLGVRTLFLLPKNRPDTDAVPSVLVKLLCATFFPAVLFAPVLNGSFDGGDSIRYNFAVYMLAPLVLGVVIGNMRPRVARLLTITGMVAYGLPLLWLCATHDVGRVLHYKPQRVIALDAIATEQGLRNGVANYWDAKVITLFSDKGLNVLPVSPDLAMHLQVNRESMFLRSATEDPLVFDFVIAHDQLTPGSVASVLASPVSIVQAGPVSVIRTRPWTFDPATRQPRPADPSTP